MAHFWPCAPLAATGSTQCRLHMAAVRASKRVSAWVARMDWCATLHHYSGLDPAYLPWGDRRRRWRGITQDRSRWRGRRPRRPMGLMLLYLCTFLESEEQERTPCGITQGTNTRKPRRCPMPPPLLCLDTDVRSVAERFRAVWSHAPRGRRDCSRRAAGMRWQAHALGDAELACVGCVAFSRTLRGQWTRWVSPGWNASAPRGNHWGSETRTPPSGAAHTLRSPHRSPGDRVSDER
jgi:hypothetical protein